MLKKILPYLLIIIFSIIFSAFRIQTVQPSAAYSLKTIVIDAGHGGKDFGAAGTSSYEKDIALAVSLKLRDQLEKALPNVRIVMTRTIDVYQHPSLKANIANQAKGDLFVCIHCNAAPPKRYSEISGYKTVTYYTGKGSKRRKHTKQVPQYRYWTTPNPAKGTETYIWAVHKNESKEVALRENESLYSDSSMLDEIADFDPESPEKRILYALKTQQYFTRSANLALMIEEEFEKAGRISRSARQRQTGIWVLQATAMPSVLVETGYITNPEEEAYLMSENGQYEICESVTKAILRYKTALESNNLLTPIQDDMSDSTR
jgi:N-acetylmuramoyl-L-alanine amidase